MRWVIVVLLCPVLLAGMGCQETEPQAPPNLILISIDTLRADHLGCYGYNRPTSPTIDAIAAQGVLFEDVTAPSPWTLPSHASMLTGLYPNRHGVNSHDLRLPADKVTLAETLAAHGLHTAAVVNSQFLSRRYGLDRGFAELAYIRENARPEPSRVGQKAIGWLEKNVERPFFLFLHYYDVHSSYSSLPNYERQFVGPYYGPIDGSTAQLQSYRQRTSQLDDRDVAHLIDLYDAGVRQMDDGIARLMSALERLQLLDDTVIAITSDHGEEFLEHSGLLHGSTHFQEVIHVPLIVLGAGLPSGERVGAISSLVDVMPTLLGLAGVSAPPNLDGIDLRPAWEKPDHRAAKRYIYSAADHSNAEHDIKRLVRQARLKLLYDRSTELANVYDLVEDPLELTALPVEAVPEASGLMERLEEYMLVEGTADRSAPLTPEETERLRSLGYLQ